MVHILHTRANSAKHLDHGRGGGVRTLASCAPDTTMRTRARIDVHWSPTHQVIPFSCTVKMKVLLVLFAALTLVAADFEFAEEWELWKKVRS